MLTPREAGLTPSDAFAPITTATSQAQALDRVRALTPDFKRDFVRQRPVVAVRTLPTARAPYPVTYAFSRACALPYPYLIIHNRALLVQFWQGGAVKTLLMNPTIPERALRAPFFARLAEGLPFAAAVRRRFLESPPVPDQLARLGLSVADIDYVAFDHQHVQDARPFLGAAGVAKLYPRARFLVQRADWAASEALHPLQRDWFVADSTQGIDTADLVLLDGDVHLGDGVCLLATPGHTWGNQSLLFRTAERGCFTVSENGVCVDAYSPEHSRIPGLARQAAKTGIELILNGNTLEGALHQYNAMMKEKLCADPLGADPRFVQHFASSELEHSPLAPGLRPTRAIEAVSEGELVSAAAAARPAASGRSASAPA